MSRIGAAPRAAASGAPTRAAAPVSSARAEASRRNGAKSRGPKSAAGKARSAQNALKHGLRAEKYVVLPDEDAAEFQALEAAMVTELAPVGALQVVLARRVAVAAWRLERADRMEAEVLEFRSYEGASAGLALIRDGNATRSFETLLRYRSAAMAEFWRALRTLKALQAEGAATRDASAPRPRIARRVSPNESERLMEYILPEPPAGRALHETAAPAPRSRKPNEPEPAAGPRLSAGLSPCRPTHPHAAAPCTTAAAPWMPNEPEPAPASPKVSQKETCDSRPRSHHRQRTAPARAG